MAERVRLDRSFLANMERGKRNVSILNLDLTAKGLKVSLSQLLSRWYVGRIRAGRRRPHPRHWQALAKLAGVSANG